MLIHAWCRMFDSVLRKTLTFACCLMNSNADCWHLVQNQEKCLVFDERGKLEYFNVFWKMFEFICTWWRMLVLGAKCKKMWVFHGAWRIDWYSVATCLRMLMFGGNVNLLKTKRRMLVLINSDGIWWRTDA